MEMDEPSDSIYETLARATSKKPRALRWTELTIYRKRGDQPAEIPSFVAEIIGDTTVEGEQRRVRRAPFATLAQALSWGSFDHKSQLFGELRHKAVLWIDTMYEEHGSLQAVGFGGLAGGGAAAKAKLAPRVTDDAPFEPVDGTFREALLWLYDPVTDDLVDAAQRFTEDWAEAVKGAAAQAAFYNAGQPIDPNDVLDVTVHEGEYGLPPWAETFRRAMRYFRRESFHAARIG
jgi:hypothetical protein